VLVEEGSNRGRRYNPVEPVGLVRDLVEADEEGKGKIASVSSRVDDAKGEREVDSHDR